MHDLIWINASWRGLWADFQVTNALLVLIVIPTVVAYAGIAAAVIRWF